MRRALLTSKPGGLRTTARLTGDPGSRCIVRMTEEGERGGRKAALRDARQARLAGALRDNLRRRKEQRRAQLADAERAPAGEAGARERDARS
jgi:hypothetical protein